MLVAEVDAASVLHVLEDRATITRLGRGVDRTQRLDSAAIDRTLEVLREYATTAAKWGATTTAVGTSALRDAENRDEFLVPAQRILGCPIQAIAGVREAELTFRGALEGIDVGHEPITVVDLGGGSTEIIVGAAGGIVQRASLDIGSVRLHERHQLSAPVSEAQAQAVRKDVRAMLAASEISPAPRMLAIAGTATTLAAMFFEVSPYDPTRVHGQRLTAPQLGSQVRRLLASSLPVRKTMAGLDPQRADVIAAGALILQELLDWSASGELVVSDGGVRFGLAREALAQIGPD